MGNPETVRQGANCELKKQDKSMVISQKKQLFENSDKKVGFSEKHKIPSLRSGFDVDFLFSGQPYDPELKLSHPCSQQYKCNNGRIKNQS